MVQCYLCKGKLRVTRDKHVYDEKLKKRYHLKCFAGICRVCDMPVHAKAKHKVIGANVWHEACYKKAHAKRRNPVKTISDASWKAMVAARKAAAIPKKLWREFEQTYFEKHPPEFEEDRENPRRPTKEFWDKVYPEVLEGFKKKYPKKEAEERARKATAAIWYEKMSPTKKAKYERLRRKREARTNPIRRLLFSGHRAPPEVFGELEGAKQQLQYGWRMVADTEHNRRVLSKHGVPFTKHQRPSAAEILRAVEEEEKRENPIKTIDTASWKAMVAARRAAKIPRDKWREFETRYFKKHPPGFEEEEKRENPLPGDAELKRTLKRDLAKLMAETRYLLVPTERIRATKMVEFQAMRPQLVQKGLYSVEDTPEIREVLDGLGMTYTPYRMPKVDIDRLIDELFAARENPVLVTPEVETDIAEAFRRVIRGVGTEADKALVRMAREADVIMSTGPSVLLKRNPEDLGPAFNPVKGKVDYIIQDEFGKVYETGTGTEEEAETRALVFNRKYMREFKVIYPKGEPADVKRAAEKATRDLLKS